MNICHKIFRTKILVERKKINEMKSTWKKPTKRWTKKREKKRKRGNLEKKRRN